MLRTDRQTDADECFTPTTPVILLLLSYDKLKVTLMSVGASEAAGRER